MTRTMSHQKYDLKVKVIEHIMTQNFWEFYVTDKEIVKQGDHEIAQCVVMGVETEYGPADLNEIKPYIVTRTKDLSDVMPASGWRWQD